MSFIKMALILIGTLLLVGFTIVVSLVYFGRKFYLSWAKPYKRAHESIEKLSNKSTPFLQEFTQHPLFYRWIRTEGKKEQKALNTLFCAADQRTREQVFSMLPKDKQKKVHAMAKATKKVTNEDIDVAAIKVKDFLRQESQQSSKPTDLSFYKLYFYDRYPDALNTIQVYKRSINPSLQRTVDEITILVLNALPYYQEQRMFEQQHKLETFLMKDLIAMLSLVVQLPPSQRPEKEEELKIYLQNFQKAMEAVERDIRDSIDHDLNVKMRAAKEKFKN
ncbi:hypothetical protein CON65_12025 [Bacillus pseudomycoides]|uniref:DUF3974 domain-containing protein n=1 Tax=Bacillus pseudomycoides TaxID=64104 RepID=A0AA91VC04_9BACI|nr:MULTISPECIES: DUF3974 domain-containing protein [Bacillus]PEB51837.1 hypothetical protein COO03_15245 [Bacillus sp. AFS098217]PED82486.1 hypothetical protein CON65_12025 [Bacillus pseudomycoides]PEU09928.1 hypothetical protein CN525_24270 [Bacillus sp. AFS014408]PEU10111.1 hypothetical protein CN524_17205 [Bacillus sp. AFS019443]PFW60374.1 hypothetical protein COL20_22165 [Bacillus sp. AFS075034]